MIEDTKSDKHLVTELEYLAARLHTANLVIAKLRSELFTKEEELLKLSSKLLQFELNSIDQDNKTIRDQYHLRSGASIKTDESTGIRYWDQSINV